MRFRAENIDEPKTAFVAALDELLDVIVRKADGRSSAVTRTKVAGKRWLPRQPVCVRANDSEALAAFRCRQKAGQRFFRGCDVDEANDRNVFCCAARAECRRPGAARPT